MALFQWKAKRKAKARLALIGPAGSGKTYSALAIATAMGNRVALMDTEHGSAEKYLWIADSPPPEGRFRFAMFEPDSFEPDAYVKAIRGAEAEGFDVVVLDSLSHAWTGKGGLLEQVDAKTRSSKSGNSYTAWRDATPQHNALIEAIIGARLHVIATMRTKTEYVIEEDPKTGKKVPRKVGLAPVQREGLEYEFDVVGDLDDAVLTITKTRCSALSGKVVRHPGADLAKTLTDWLTDGVDVPESARPARKEDVTATWEAARAKGFSPDTWAQTVKMALGSSKPSAYWTVEDLAKVRTAVDAVAVA